MLVCCVWLVWQVWSRKFGWLCLVWFVSFGLRCMRCCSFQVDDWLIGGLVELNWFVEVATVRTSRMTNRLDLSGDSWIK